MTVGIKKVGGTHGTNPLMITTPSQKASEDAAVNSPEENSIVIEANECLKDSEILEICFDAKQSDQGDCVSDEVTLAGSSNVGQCFSLNSMTETVATAVSEEMEWVDNVRAKLQKDDYDNDKLSWSAFHAAQMRNTRNVADLGCILPLFHEKADTAAMVARGLNIMQQSIQLLNKGQIPVCAFDLPLYIRAKHLQWN